MFSKILVLIAVVINVDLLLVLIFGDAFVKSGMNVETCIWEVPSFLMALIVMFLFLSLLNVSGMFNS